MNSKKDNYELYRNTFDKLHASDELVRKVKNMTTEKRKTKIYTLRKAICVAAAAAMFFAVSNIVTFAATGETLVEMLACKIIYNGEEKDLDIAKKTDENGEVSYDVSFDVEEKNGESKEYSFSLDGETHGEYGYGEPQVLEFYSAATIVEEDGRIYLEMTSPEIKEDITEDFADGKATVTVALKDTDYITESITLTVEGTVDDYTVDMI